MSLAIVPGSFDPMTLGHLALIRRVAERYDEVVVAVMINSAKRYLFDMETRVLIAGKTVADLANVRVIADEGMLIDLYDRLGADAVCKGYRNEVDYDYEMKMAEWNRAHNPRFHTELIPAEAGFEAHSSTCVRDKLAAGESLDGLVHPSASALILSARRNEISKNEK